VERDQEIPVDFRRSGNEPTAVGFVRRWHKERAFWGVLFLCFVFLSVSGCAQEEIPQQEPSEEMDPVAHQSETSELINPVFPEIHIQEGTDDFMTSVSGGGPVERVDLADLNEIAGPMGPAGRVGLHAPAGRMGFGGFPTDVEGETDSVYGDCQEETTEILPGLCMDDISQPELKFPEAADQCFMRGGHVCSYTEFYSACIRDLAGITKGGSMYQMWIGNWSSHSLVMFGNTTGDDDCSEFAGTSYLNVEREYRCCFSPFTAGH